MPKIFPSADTRQNRSSNERYALAERDPLLSGILRKESRPPLKFSGFLVAAGAHAHGVVPAARRHGAALRGAVVAHSLAAGAAVVLGQLGSELALAVVARQDVLVGHPVGRTSCVFHQA